MLEICNLRTLIIRRSGQYKIETCGSITKLTFGCILISWYLTDVMKTIAVNYKYTVNSCGLLCTDIVCIILECKGIQRIRFCLRVTLELKN